MSLNQDKKNKILNCVLWVALAIYGVIGLMILISCNSPKIPLCSYLDCEEEFSSLNYCPSYQFPEGNWEIVQTTAWMCNCDSVGSFDECCEPLYFPIVGWDACAVYKKGYITFLNFSKFSGTVHFEVYGKSSCSPMAQFDPFFGTGCYSLEMWDNQTVMEYRPFAPYGREFYLVPHIDLDTEEGIIRVLDKESLRPYFDFKVRKQAEATQCMDSYSPYRIPRVYGYCYSDSNCFNLFGSCMTEDRCLELLRYLDIDEGGWKTIEDVTSCHPLKVPEPAK